MSPNNMHKGYYGFKNVETFWFVEHYRNHEDAYHLWMDTEVHFNELVDRYNDDASIMMRPSQIRKVHRIEVERIREQDRLP